MKREKFQETEKRIEEERNAFIAQMKAQTCGTCKHWPGDNTCQKFPKIGLAKAGNRSEDGCYSGWEPK